MSKHAQPELLSSSSPPASALLFRMNRDVNICVERRVPQLHTESQASPVDSPSCQNEPSRAPRLETHRATDVGVCDAEERRLPGSEGERVGRELHGESDDFSTLWGVEVCRFRREEGD